MIEAFGLGKDFGTLTAVRDVTLTVAEGEVVVLLGPNGAGKTTTVRMLAAILRPTRGRATVAGHDVAREAVQVREHVGLLTEFPGLYERMRVLDYLAFFGRLHGLSPSSCRARSESLLRRFGLWESRRLHLGEFSKGMRQKVALVRALLHDPPVLLLDEPTSAMDPSSARMVRDCIRELRAAGHTLLICTHNLAEAEELADRIAIIRQGHIIALDTPQGLRRQLLGPPLMEARLNDTHNNFGILEEMVQIVSRGPGWVRYLSPRPEQINPQVIRRLMEAGAEVVTLSEVPRSLEEVYLRLVEAGEAGTVPPPPAQPAGAGVARDGVGGSR
ncbi:MAG: ABC transporter ATP-binding protein [Chloroflexia bacterium]